MGIQSQVQGPGAPPQRPRDGAPRRHGRSRFSELALSELLQWLGIAGAVVLAAYLPIGLGPAGWIGTILIGALLTGMLLVWIATEVVRSRELWVAGIVTITMSLLAGAAALLTAFIDALISA